MKLEFLGSGSLDCPLIRLYGFQTTEVVRLKELFDQLANGSRSVVLLDEQTGIESIGGCQLALRVGALDAGIVQNGNLRFECRLTTTGWADVASLAQPLGESSAENKWQWLNRDGDVSLLLSETGQW